MLCSSMLCNSFEWILMSPVLQEVLCIASTSLFSIPLPAKGQPGRFFPLRRVADIWCQVQVSRRTHVSVPALVDSYDLCKDVDFGSLSLSAKREGVSLLRRLLETIWGSSHRTWHQHYGSSGWSVWKKSWCSKKIVSVGEPERGRKGAAWGGEKAFVRNCMADIHAWWKRYQRYWWW